MILTRYTPPAIASRFWRRSVLFSSAQWTTCSPASIPGCANIFTGRGRARLPQASRPIMEIKSNNILIGFSTLIVLVLILGFSLWISRVQLDRQYAYYKIVFSGSLSGFSSEEGRVGKEGVRT